jgi:hypothetical protein
VSELREEMTRRALGLLAGGMGDAAGRLRELLSAEADSVKLAAARSILQLGVELRSAVELEQRLRAVEESLDRAAGAPA